MAFAQVSDRKDRTDDEHQQAGADTGGDHHALPRFAADQREIALKPFGAQLFDLKFLRRKIELGPDECRIGGCREVTTVIVQTLERLEMMHRRREIAEGCVSPRRGFMKVHEVVVGLFKGNTLEHTLQMGARRGIVSASVSRLRTDSVEKAGPLCSLRVAGKLERRIDRRIGRGPVPVRDVQGGDIVQDPRLKHRAVHFTRDVASPAEMLKRCFDVPECCVGISQIVECRQVEIVVLKTCRRVLEVFDRALVLAGVIVDRPDRLQNDGLAARLTDGRVNLEGALEHVEREAMFAGQLQRSPQRCQDVCVELGVSRLLAQQFKGALSDGLGLVRPAQACQRLRLKPVDGCKGFVSNLRRDIVANQGFGLRGQFKGLGRVAHHRTARFANGRFKR